MLRAEKLLLVLAGALTLIALALVWYVAFDVPSRVSPGRSLSSVGGPFSLTDQDGRTRTDRDFRGRFMLVYFGYTWCPDVCPTTLQRISDALSKLGGRSRDIVPVFISVDPDRDTPAVLKKYLAAFGPEFVGLTGTKSAIARAAGEYRVYFAREDVKGGPYAVTHSSTFYLVGRDGKLVTFYDADTTAGALLKDLRARLN